MNTYQKKWLDLLSQIHIPGWKFSALGDDILINVPADKDIKAIADNLETVIAEASLDMDLPGQRLRFVISNSREEVDYILNPEESDLTTGDNN